MPSQFELTQISKITVSSLELNRHLSYNLSLIQKFALSEILLICISLLPNCHIWLREFILYYLFFIF